MDILRMIRLLVVAWYINKITTANIYDDFLEVRSAMGMMREVRLNWSNHA